MNNITNIVGKIVLDAKVSVINDLIEHLNEHEDLQSNIIEQISQFRNYMASNSNSHLKVITKMCKRASKKFQTPGTQVETEKKKREPSMFNIFVKNRIPEIKASGNYTRSSLITMAASAWKTDSFALFVKSNMHQMKKEYPNCSNIELYEKMKESFSNI